MLIIISLIIIYLGCGLLFGLTIDKEEMQKHVPYGQAPSIFPLERIRTGIITLAALLGVPAIIYCGIKVFLEEFKRKRKLKIAIKHLDKVSKRSPELQALWAPIREKVKKRL